MSHLQEYLLFSIACERGLALDCRKSFKMQSALAKHSDQYPHLAGCI